MPDMPSTAPATPVTIIGLGPMGQALARAFLARGHATTVWNRTLAKADALVAAGASRASTAEQAVAASPLTVVCLLNYAAVRDALGTSAPALRGRTLLNLTSGTPHDARQMAAWAAAQGIDYLDGAIMSPTYDIGQPSALVLYSGREPVYQQHETTLQSLGGSAFHLGSDPGRAAAHDIALLDFFWTTMGGYVHALALAKREGIAAADFARFAKGIAEIMPPIITEIATHVDTESYPGHDSNIVSAAASLDHVIHAAEAHRLETDVLRAIRAIAQRALDAGHGAEGVSRLAAVLGTTS